MKDSIKVQLEKKEININKKILELKNELEKERKVHELLTEKESIIISTLEKMHLTPTNICIPSGGGYIRLDAVSINGKFKFIKDQGCNSNGQNKNHQTLYNKSEKMTNKLNDAVGLKFSVNPFSLEENEKLGNKNSVLIQIYI